ncbi:MAG: hypothetical protein G01um10148_349 [Parcubacteria group bacterium Gr01-1014_8]|nr:MAG: hypothetical protein G01um10148_349 [Parcubacteria group bacterium Gr01-1014_8]
MNRLPIILGCLSLVLSATIIAGEELYVYRERLSAMTAPEKIFGFLAFSEFLTVYSIDLEHRKLVGITRIPSVNLDVPTLYSLAPDFFVERRDVIIENGAVVGTSSTTPATIDDVVPGTHGYGSVYINPQGQLVLSYLLIGEPFPRP